jgi:2-C-methyl-D-erythritol 4-phosphate cytidylyltransferase
VTAWLILPAAGSGQRFGGSTSKLLQAISGLPVIAHSLRAFRGLVAGAIIPTRVDLIDQIRALAAEHGPTNCRVIAGGADRLGSVRLALDALPDSAERVLVHDAARPCILRDDILACLQALEGCPACLLARPCCDTLKRVGEGSVTATVDRADLWLAETPQGFQRRQAAACYARAEREGWTCTDDAGLFERCGLPVRIVAARHPNPKLTHPGDARLIAALLSSQEEHHGP